MAQGVVRPDAIMLCPDCQLVQRGRSDCYVIEILTASIDRVCVVLRQCDLIRSASQEGM